MTKSSSKRPARNAEGQCQSETQERSWRLPVAWGIVVPVIAVTATWISIRGQGGHKGLCRDRTLIADEGDAAYFRLLAKIRASGGFAHVSLSDCLGEEGELMRGLASARDFSVGNHIAKIPAEFILHPEIETRLSQIVTKVSSSDADVKVLAYTKTTAVLLREMSKMSSEKGSKHADYIRTLPTQVPYTFASGLAHAEEEAFKLVAWPSMVQQFETILNGLLRLSTQQPKLFGGLAPSENEVRKAFSLVKSRSMEQMMVPVTDLANHADGDSANAKVACGFTAAGVVSYCLLIAKTVIAKGSEVLIDYKDGIDFSNIAMFAIYGFIPSHRRSKPTREFKLKSGGIASCKALDDTLVLPDRNAEDPLPPGLRTCDQSIVDAFIENCRHIVSQWDGTKAPGQLGDPAALVALREHAASSNVSKQSASLLLDIVETEVASLQRCGAVKLSSD